jgi:hypothetical protein
MRKSHLRNLTPYAIVALPILIAVLPNINFSPIWDGAFYAQCVIRSVSEGFSLWTLNCANHPSLASFITPALAYKLSGGALWSIHVANLLLALCAVWCFLGILNALFPEAPQAERILGAACLSAMPVISASVLHTNADLGVFVFSVVLLFALLKRRRWLACLASAALPLTKEVGLGIWVIILGSYILAEITRRDESYVSKLKKIFYFWTVISAPIAFWWYASGRLTRGLPILQPPLPGARATFLQNALSFSPFDVVLQSYLSSMFVLNFSWLLTLLILCGFAGGTVRWAFGAFSKTGSMRRELIVCLFISILILLTRFKTFANVRYFLPMFPVILLAAFLALQSSIRWERIRILLLGIILVAFEASTFRLIDPLSKRVYGTFMFGKNEMLHMTSITGECCDLGRDQIVYNTEFTYIDYLTNDLLADLKPSESLPIVLPNNGQFYFIRGILGSPSPKRVAAISRPDVISVPILLSPIKDTPQKRAPERVVWIDLPNIYGKNEFRALLSSYRVLEEKVYARQGYEIHAKIMQHL